MNKNTPLYLQVYNNLVLKIATGKELSSVQEIALEYKINQNTVEKAVATLIENGLIDAEYHVLLNEKDLNKLKDEIVYQNIDTLLINLKDKGFDNVDIKKSLKKWMKNNK